MPTTQFVARIAVVPYLSNQCGKTNQLGKMAHHYSQPLECNLPKSTVDKIAANFASQVEYAPGADLFPIVERLRGKIIVRNVLEMSDQISGSIKIEENGSFEIVLASHTGPARDRFTIAHELGHYVLHYIYPNQIGTRVERLEANRYGTGRVEWEANWFAAGFLMPADAFKSAYSVHQGNIPVLAKLFGVSVEAARVRATFFGF